MNCRPTKHFHVIAEDSDGDYYNLPVIKVNVSPYDKLASVLVQHPGYEDRRLKTNLDLARAELRDIKRAIKKLKDGMEGVFSYV